MKKDNSTPSLTSPKGNQRGCLCKENNTLYINMKK
jgi:hypothetical protein